ncbi:MAG: ATP synthase F1 subunit epsilon/F-type H+-transporting ATPase subunit epsilon [Treponematales bacterium]
MKPFTFEVHTPYRRFYSGSVETIVLTLTDGEIAVYAGHSFFTAPVVPCALRLKEKGAWKEAAVAAGVLEVKEEKTVLLTDAAEWPEEIDKERAVKEREDARNTLAANPFHFEAERAKAALKRAETRLRVTGSGEQG